MRTLHRRVAVEQQPHACGPFIGTKGATLRERAKAYIGGHIREADLSVDRIAAALDCSKRYLHLVFNAGDETVSGYVWRQRLEGCRAELSDPALRRTLTDVAYAWGFNSSAHFSRAFKERYGLSPSALRLRSHATAPGRAAITAMPAARLLGARHEPANVSTPHP